MTHPANPCTPKRSKFQIQIIFLVLNCNHPTKQVIPIKIKTHARGDNGKPSPTFSGSASTTFFHAESKDARCHLLLQSLFCRFQQIKRGEHLLTRINRLISFTAQTHINAQLIPFVSFSILMDNIPKREPLLSFRINNLPFNTPFYYITRTGSAIIIEKVITVNPILRQIILFQQSSELLFSEIVKFNVC